MGIFLGKWGSDGVVKRENIMKKIFSFRAFTVLIIFWSFILETVSGVILYIVPPGRVANWTNWKLWGLTKHGWAAVHTIFGYVFLIFVVIHFYYNWKPIIHYMRRKIKMGLRLRMELIVSVIVTILITVATIISIPPFSSIMDLGENFKNSWEENRAQVLAPHSELLTFEEFIKEIGITKKDALSKLKDKGIQGISDKASINDIALANRMSPSDFYTIVNPSASGLKQAAAVKRGESGSRRTAPTVGRGRGYGWKTLKDLARDLDMPVARLLSILKENGITARENETVRKVAEKHDKGVFDLVDLISQKR